MSAQSAGQSSSQGSGQDFGKTLGVTFVIALVCSLVVTGTHLALKPVQESWTDVARYRSVLDVSGLLPDTPATDRELAALMRQLEVRDVEVSRKVNGDVKVATEPVFLVWTDDRLQRVILPVAGQGMWAPIRGYLALEPDLRTVAEISFHDIGDTPGIGDRIQEPEWRAQWRGKAAFNDAGEAVLGSGDDPRHRIDAVAGATITSMAAMRLVRDALGADGFGPFLDRLRRENLRPEGTGP